MFGPISTLPQLLPQLFGLTGQAIPKQFSEYIQPTIEIFDFIASNNALEVVTGVQNVAAAGLIRPPELTVPDTEAWLVKGASFIASTGAAEVLRCRLMAGRTSSTGDRFLRDLDGPGFSSPTDAAGAAFVALAAPRAGLFYAGDFVGASVEKITTAATIALTFRADIFRFAV